MKCQKCLREFEEKDLQESHDIPCYLFIYSGNRKGQKNDADKCGRHLLCKRCHEEYEKILNNMFKTIALDFSKKYFGDTNDTD